MTGFLKKVVSRLGIRKTMMLSNIVLLTAMLFIVSVVSHFVILGMYADRIRESVNSRLESAVSDLNRRLDYFDTVLIEFTLNQNIQNIAQINYRNQSEVYETYYDLENVITPVVSCNTDLGKIIVFLNNQSVKYSLNTSDFKLNSGFDDRWYRKVRRSQTAVWAFKTIEDYRYLTLSRSIRFKIDGSNLGVAELGISINFFTDLENSGNDSGRYILQFYDSDGNCLGKESEELEKIGKLVRSHNQAKGYFYDADLSVPSYISYQYSATQGLYTVMAMEKEPAPVIYTDVLIILAAALALAIGIIMSGLVSKGILGSINSLVAKIRSFHLGENIDIKSSYSKDEIGYIENQFDQMSRRVNTLFNDVYQYKAKIREIELSALQSQIKPHFLYNTLSLINWMAIDIGARDISKAINTLAKYYRLTLTPDMNTTTIGKELEQVSAYVELIRLRFKDNLEFSVSSPQELAECKIPKMILQPIVENSIVHGFKENNRKLTVCVEVCTNEKGILLSVKDDGKGMSAEQIAEIMKMNNPSKNYGLRNICEKIHILYGAEYGIKIESEIDHGTTVLLMLPLA